MSSALAQAGYSYNKETLVWIRHEYAGIAYSDGDEVERRIASIIGHATDLGVLSDELRPHCTDWPSLYHLSGTRANILRPFESELRGDILEIGAGCGAITRFLGECGGNVLALEGSPRRASIARARTRDLNNVTVVCDKFDDFSCDQRFDVVTLIGVLEYANLFTAGAHPTLAMLERVRNFLKPSGKLIIAIENQLGLKYFAGAPEDHIGIPMYGIEARYRNDQPQTFGRKELAGLIKQAGFLSTEFLAPFPDYKLPVSIVTERGFSCDAFDAAALAWQSVCRDPQLPPNLAFSPELVWPTVVNNGLALDLANSFLIVASLAECEGLVPPNRLAWHYTTDRRTELCKRAEFLEIDAHKAEVRYQRLNQNADNPVVGSLLQHYLPERDEYRRGNVLSSEIIRAVTQDGWRIEEVSHCLHQWINFISKLAKEQKQTIDLSDPSSQLPGGFFDCIPQNIIISSDNSFHVIDKEWVANEKLELGYLTFRSVWAVLHTIKRFGRPEKESIKTLYDFILSVMNGLGWIITNEDIARWIEFEYKIQSEVAGRVIASVGVLDWLKKTPLPTANLSQAVTERDGQIASLNQAVAERDGQIASQYAQLMTFSNWASSIDKHPLKHAFKKTALGIARGTLRSMPVSIATKQRLRDVFFSTIRPLRQSVRRKSAQVRPADEAAPPRGQRPSAGVARDVFVFAVIDWHFRIQRPQHIARSLAESGHRVFYFSNHFVDADEPGYQLERLPGADALYQVKLHVKGAPAIYFDPPSDQALAMLTRSIAKVIQDFSALSSLSIVQHAYWYPLVKRLPNSYRIYDCMDHHEGFGNVPAKLVEIEKEMLCSADLVTVTSSWLEDFARKHNPSVALVRNAAEYRHFVTRPEQVYKDGKGRRIIGYYGAIAEWFDIDLVRTIALEHPDCLILLVGNDTVGAQKVLADLPNVEFTGEVPYATLPFYLHAFDVCLLPFKVIPLTLATNPVKVYEYLAAGKPVVCVDLPEVGQFGDLVSRACSTDDFVALVGASLQESGVLAEQKSAERRRFASEQTWCHRGAELATALKAVRMPRVSVIILTFNNLDLTRACLDSVLERSDYPNLEVIVVDNASSDGTSAYLEDFARRHPDVRVVLNRENLGFAAGNNVGLSIATGDYLVVLNNDTVVTQGWVMTLLRHFQNDPSLGIVGPVTNNIGNEARIETRYQSIAEMPGEALRYTLANMGKTYPMRTVAFFCVMFPRSVYELCGPICEDYGLGFFEDDDYCRRVESIGKRVVCAEDVFIHHHLSASFNKLKDSERQELFRQNKEVYEKKWGAWVPHSYRNY